MPSRSLVLDANILIRAVLGKRVRQIIEAHAEAAAFFVPDAAFVEAEEHLATLVVRRGGDPGKAVALLGAVGLLVEQIGLDVYGEFEAEARTRLRMRDPDDWRILASALALQCPIWTEDQDFFRLRRGYLDVRPAFRCSCGSESTARRRETSRY